MQPGPSHRLRRLACASAWGLGVLVLVLAAAALLAWNRLAASLPLVAGERMLPGLRAPVTVERDVLGVATVRGESEADVARATGFVHAQERFFQMDLSRRRAAGELAELFGPVAVEADREVRRHRFRVVAAAVLERLDPAERELLEAYAGGVNAGLGALGSRPFEYHLLREEPREWAPADCVLVLLSMFLELHDQGLRERAIGTLYDALPEPLAAFLDARGGEWDAPLLGEAFAVPPIPGPEVVDLGHPEAAPAAAPADGSTEPSAEPTAAAGSNNFAVAGAHTAHGGAILAGDMHLPLRVPATWYRVRFEWQGGAPNERRAATGVTLPGAPFLVAGSNGQVAWTFTNSQGDFADLVVVETDPADPGAYLAPTGRLRFERHEERIRVKGEEDVTLEVTATIWGPLVGRDGRGRWLALRWTAHDPEAVNIRHRLLASARSLEELLALAPATGSPPQNLVAADARGRIGWTLLGVVPRRKGFDGRRPVSWADGSRRWQGWLEPEHYPVLVDPPIGRIWTANARTVAGDALERLGDGGYDLGARARQIRDRLLALERADENDLLRVQLDDEALFLGRWRGLLLEVLASGRPAKDVRFAEVKRQVEAWGGHAAPSSVGFRLVRAFRLAVLEQALAPIVAPCRRLDPGFDPGQLDQIEGPLWRLVEERPAHLLDARFAGWDELLAAALERALQDLTRDGTPVDSLTWGRRNTARIRHPLSAVLPGLGRWLDMPADELPGAENMPRVQTPAFGASQRMVVSPGREESGIFHMPGGQSGHPLSPHYRDGHRAWSRGGPAPFLPGAAVDVLTLKTPEASP